MKPDVEIIDVTLRDGLQNEIATVDLAKKRALLDQLIDAGLKRLEVTSFTNPKRVPQMADAEAFLSGLPKDGDVTFSALVLNKAGFARAAAAAVSEINFVVVATDTFSRCNQGKDTVRILEDWESISSEAGTLGIKRTVTVGAAFGCPFEGHVDEKHVTDIAVRVADIGVDELVFADTIGVGVPTAVKRLADLFMRAVPDVPLRAHFHNTRNTGYANAVAAVESGITRLDASCGGIGGCPFAPGAAGNVATEDLVYLLEGMGMKTDIDRDRLAATARWLTGVVRQPVPGQLHRTPPFPPEISHPSVTGEVRAAGAR